jgi:acyl carrier protein
MDKKELKEHLKKHIVKYVNILDYKPEQIPDTLPLFGPQGLGLDSIDTLELSVMLEREYGIKLTDPAEARRVLLNIETVADYIISTKSTLVQ